MVVGRLPIVVMGISGSGKSTVGAALGAALGFRFLDGDDLHSPSSVDKMRRGVPLDDGDRAPWLAAIAAQLADSRNHGGIVVACSALKRAYRDTLRLAPGLRFIFLDAGADLAELRMAGRASHFMSRTLLASQLATLEEPSPDESDVLRVPAGATIEEIVRAAKAFVGR